MDDLIESVPTLKDAKKLASDMEKVLITGGFQIKEWMYSYNASHVQSILPVTPNTATEKVLGVEWNTNQDELCFKVKLNLQGKMKKKNPKPITCDALIKRKILSKQLLRAAPLSDTASEYCWIANGFKMELFQVVIL